METALSSQPNQSFTFPDTPQELEGILEIPDRPEISGGYADVYHGFWTNSQGERVDVAIKILKVLNPRSRQSDQDSLVKKAETRLKREIFFWSQTRHPNLHPFLGYRLQPQPHLVSPWCRHGDLGYYLKSNPNLSRYEKLLLVYQAGRGLHHLHSCSPPICHADIKPGNVLVNNLGQATLSDFGLSRAMLDLDVTSGFTTSETVKGTFAYMAGELSSGQKPSCASDVYAFGSLILTVMSNQPPFHGLAQLVILRRIMQNEPPKPEDHPGLPAHDPLWELMRRCWDQRPAARPTISEVLIDLREDIGLKEPDPQLSSDLATPIDAGGSDYPETDFEASAKHTQEEIDSSNTSKETPDHVLEVVPNSGSFSVSPKANVPSPTPEFNQPTPTGDGRDKEEAFPRALGQAIAVQQPGQPIIVTAPPPGQPLIIPTGQPIMIPLHPGQTGQPPIMIQQPSGGAPFALQPGQQYIIGQPGMPFVQQLASSRALPSPALPPSPRPLDAPLSGSPSVNNAKSLVPPWKQRSAAARAPPVDDPTRRTRPSRKDSRTDSNNCVIQ